jgi:transposase
MQAISLEDPSMMTKDAEKNRTQIQYFCMDDLVPKDHLLRLIEEAIEWDFIYDLVEDRYCPDWGRPSMDPVTLIKIPFIQYLYGIRSMRQTIKEIEVNVAYRWFLGLDMYDPVPHFTTFGKNYTRRFKDCNLHRLADIDAFQSGHLAGQNGHPETQCLL